MNKYYEVEGYIDGEREVLFGSFDKSDCKYELEAEREGWKAEGYKKIKLVVRETQETPDPDVYGEELYQAAICKALKDSDVTVDVGDMSEDYQDLEGSRDIGEIIKACEATDSPVVTFYKNDVLLGAMLVMVGQGDESIVDHHCNDFMDNICEIKG